MTGCPSWRQPVCRSGNWVFLSWTPSLAPISSQTQPRGRPPSSVFGFFTLGHRIYRPFLGRVHVLAKSGGPREGVHAHIWPVRGYIRRPARRITGHQPPWIEINMKNQIGINNFKIEHKVHKQQKLKSLTEEWKFPILVFPPRHMKFKCRPMASFVVNSRCRRILRVALPALDLHCMSALALA